MVARDGNVKTPALVGLYSTLRNQRLRETDLDTCFSRGSDNKPIAQRSGSLSYLFGGRTVSTQAMYANAFNTRQYRQQVTDGLRAVIAR